MSSASRSRSSSVPADRTPRSRGAAAGRPVMSSGPIGAATRVSGAATLSTGPATTSVSWSRRPAPSPTSPSALPAPPVHDGLGHASPIPHPESLRGDQIMVAQTIERTETRPTEQTDRPDGLTAPESAAYVRGYSRGCLDYVKKHGGPSMVLEGPAPAAGTPARRQLAAELRTITTAHLIERHPAAHRAGMAALRKYRKTHGIAEPVAPAAPRKTSTRKPRALAAVPDPAPVVVDDAPADADDGHVYVTATVRDRDGVPTDVYAGSMPDWAWSDPAHARAWKAARRREILADRTTDPRGWRVTFRTSSLAWSAAPGDVAPEPAAPEPAAPVVEAAPVVTIAPAPAADESTEERRPNRTRRAARRQLAEDMRARGEDPTDPAAWAAAKLAAGIK